MLSESASKTLRWPVKLRTVSYTHLDVYKRQGDARIEAAAIVNRHGTLAGRDLTITATAAPAPTDAVDNREGLILADNALTLRAASLDTVSYTHLFVIWADAVRTVQPRPTLNGVMLS